MSRSQYELLSSELDAPLQGGDPYLPQFPILNLVKRPKYIEGDWRGRHLHIHNFSRGSGDNRSTYHAIKLSVQQQNSNLTFKLGAEGFFSKIGKTFGMQDIQTGDPEFDQAFVVKSNDETFIHSAFLPEIRAQFLAIGQQFKFGSLELSRKNLNYNHRGYLNQEQDRQRAVALVRAMADLAAAIEVYSGSEV